MEQEQARKHYHAGWNMAGYLPEMDVETFTSFRAARSFVFQAAREQLASNREYGDSGIRWTLSGRDGDYWLDNDDAHHLPEHYWVSDPCYCTDVEDDSY